METDDIRGPGALGLQARARFGRHVAQLPVGLDEGHLRRRVLRNRREHPRVRLERGPQRGGDDGSGDGPAARTGEPGGAEQLGEPVDGQEIDGGDPEAM